MRYIETVLKHKDPRFIHIKDPFLGTHRGQTMPDVLFPSILLD